MGGLLNIANCVNYGSIESDGKYTGGIVGLSFGDVAKNIAHTTISNCLNYGLVKARSDGEVD